MCDLFLFSFWNLDVIYKKTLLSFKVLSGKLRWRGEIISSHILQKEFPGNIEFVI